MGIYTDDKIFGIRIYNFIDDKANILFEEKYEEIMTHEQMMEARLFYDSLNDKDNLCFSVYVQCTSTLHINIHNYMDWQKLSFMDWQKLSLHN